MAIIEITVTNPKHNNPLLRETFEITPELAKLLVKRMMAMAATLSPPTRVNRKVSKNNGVMVIEIEITAQPPEANPSFEERFRRAGKEVKPA